MKKIIAGVLVAVLWFAVVITYTVIATKGDDDEDAHEFTVLTVKEETVKDYNTMPVFKDLARATGRDVYWIYNTSTQYANNTDPVGINGIDAIYHSGFSNLQLYNYGRSGRIVAIDEYLKNDKVMPNLYKILEERPDIKEALTIDGHIYSLPRVEEMGLKAHPNLLFINKAWVQKLIDGGNLPAGVELSEADLVDGLKLTRNQFKAILQKFNDLDMDGDGSTQNEVPLSFVSGNWQGNEADLIASFGVPENTEHKTVVDGKITFTIESENWFNAVKELNDWYNKNLIRSTAFTQTQDEFLAKGQDGRYGAFYWWEKETVVSKNLQDDYVMLQPLVDDATGMQFVGVSNELEIEKGECVILSSCKDKAGLLSYFDKFFEPIYSAQLNYGSIESGAFEKYKEGEMLIHNTDHGAQSADDFRMKNAPYGVVYLNEGVWGNEVQMEPRAQLRLERLDVYLQNNAFTNVTSIPNLNYSKEELDTLNRYENSLGKNITSWFTTRVTSKSAPTVSDWQNFLKTNATSIQQVTNVNQAAYERYVEAAGK